MDEAHDALPCTASSAASLTSSARAQTTAATSTSVGRIDDHALEVPERLRERSLVLVGDDEHRALLAPGLDERGCLLRRRLVERGLVDDGQRALGCMRAERSAQSRAIRLAVDLDRVAAGLRREGDAAARELRARGSSRRVRGRFPSGATASPRPPATSPRLFADCVPARCALSSARTASWTRCGFTSEPNTPSSRLASREDLPRDPEERGLRRRHRASPLGSGRRRSWGPESRP